MKIELLVRSAFTAESGPAQVELAQGCIRLICMKKIGRCALEKKKLAKRLRPHLFRQVHELRTWECWLECYFELPLKLLIPEV